MDYGKKSIQTSYSGGKVTAVHIYYSIPVKILEKTQVLDEIMSALELLSNRQTEELTICLKAEDGVIKALTKSFEVEER